jgi:AdoMet-dependent rRNA methyltransferase SPB1
MSTSSHRGADSDDLEVVPQATGGDGDSTDTDAEFEAMEDSAKAEIRAMARKWLGGRKMQLSILDAGYNRYTFNDEGLPRWFREDEAKHMQPGKLVEQAEIAAEREAMRPVDARPLRKVCA